MSPQTKAETSYSLQKRLFWAFGILLILFLGLTGLVLDRAFKQSVAASVEERLLLQVYTLLGAAESDSSGFFVPELEDPAFSQINSGLYGFILNPSNQEVWRSVSALNIDLLELDLRSQLIEPGQVVYGRLRTEEQGNLSYAAYATLWENLAQEYKFIVLESVEPTDAEIREFQNSLWVWLGGLTVFLSLTQIYLLRWGLGPLQALADDLSDIEAGKKDQLTEKYPKELMSVSQNLNALIKHERERQGRYRTTLDDLAHSLKTPLAVISGILQETDLKDKEDKKNIDEISEQLSRMNQIITYQLKRAVKSEHARLLSKPVNVAKLVRKIAAALNKVYAEKSIQLILDLQENALFHGEESDLTEVMGNLLDNAFKYCKSKVVVHAKQEGKSLYIAVDDDGGGIAEENRQWVLERGVRADTMEKGQGIGLAVTLDIVSSYGGTINVTTSDLGGASIKLLLKRT